MSNMFSLSDEIDIDVLFFKTVRLYTVLRVTTVSLIARIYALEIVV
jgi:hypothetical protein